MMMMIKIFFLLYVASWFYQVFQNTIIKDDWQCVLKKWLKNIASEASYVYLKICNLKHTVQVHRACNH